MNLYKSKISELVKGFFVCLLGLLLCYPSATFAQISEGGIPPSFQYPQTRSAIQETTVPVDFYIEDLRETDNWQARTGVPMPVSTLISVDYTMDNSGYYTTLPGGENIWQLQLKAKDAVAIMLYYKDFYIPEGGKLFIYSTDKSQLLGAYTHRTHPSGGLFATEFVGGDELILEYVTSDISEEAPRIHISEIGYGYNTAALREFCGITTRATSGSCMVNINCEEGDAWQNEKKSVCYTIQRIGSKNYICTASLMNNTAEDFKPLVLTARHCAYDGSHAASSSDMEQWQFYFHREREGCSNSSLPVVSQTMTGCKLLVNTGMSGGSDGMLLLLNKMVPENYDVFYNGWDRRGIAASSGVCIHHPSGDYKKISTYDEAIQNYTFEASEFVGDKNAHWNVFFAETANGHGITEDGSSGSPLYNENKLVIGTLTGGSSSCAYRRGLNIYGKMNYHWNKYKTDSSTRMDVWLDPLNKGVETFAGRSHKIWKPSPTDLKVVNQGQTVSLTWKAPKDSETPEHYNIYRNNTKIGEAVSLSFIDYKPLNGSIVYAVSAVYADEEESTFAIATMMSYVQYKAPSNLEAKRLSSRDNQVLLTWNAPVYEQSIFWGTMDATYMVGLENKTPFYYGQKWSSEEISPLNEKKIKAVQFIPIEGNDYEIYISQGGRSYTQKINSSSLVYQNFNTVELETPFIIDGSNSLIVSIHTLTVVTEYPAVCDDGPAVNNKGNIYSVNGNEWMTFYDEENPDDYNYNFIVIAIVSSESGTIPAEEKGLFVHHLKTTGYADIVPRVKAIAVDEQAPSLRSSQPVAFPEVTKYKIYRGGSIYKSVDAPKTTYTDNYLSNYYYEVSAIYDDIESERSNQAKITIVDTEQIDAGINIFPTHFSNYVVLKGYESVVRIDVISVSGKVCLVVNNPDEQINTSSLSPGLYFFRILDSKNQQKVVRAIKAK